MGLTLDTKLLRNEIENLSNVSKAFSVNANRFASYNNSTELTNHISKISDSFTKISNNINKVTTCLEDYLDDIELIEKKFSEGSYSMVYLLNGLSTYVPEVIRSQIANSVFHESSDFDTQVKESWKETGAQGLALTLAFAEGFFKPFEQTADGILTIASFAINVLGYEEGANALNDFIETNWLRKGYDELMSLTGCDKYVGEEWDLLLNITRVTGEVYGVIVMQKYMSKVSTILSSKLLNYADEFISIYSQYGDDLASAGFKYAGKLARAVSKYGGKAIKGLSKVVSKHIQFREAMRGIGKAAQSAFQQDVQKEKAYAAAFANGIFAWVLTDLTQSVSRNNNLAKATKSVLAGVINSVKPIGDLAINTFYEYKKGDNYFTLLRENFIEDEVYLDMVSYFFQKFIPDFAKANTPFRSDIGKQTVDNAVKVTAKLTSDKIGSGIFDLIKTEVGEITTAITLAPALVSFITDPMVGQAITTTAGITVGRYAVLEGAFGLFNKIFVNNEDSTSTSYETSGA